MKKLNKLFLGAASVASVAAPIAAVISCGIEEENVLPTYVDSTFASTDATTLFGATDGGDKNDHSFNEQAFEAVKTIAGSAHENNFISSTSSSTSDILAAYNQAFSNGATGIVATGFMHGGALDQASAQNPNKAFIYVDGVTKASKDGAEVLQGNVANLLFKSEQGGFLAGYEAATESKTHKVATFGGMNIPSVVSYMDGFMQGVKYYNDNKASDKVAVEIIGQDNAFVGNFEADKGNLVTTRTNDLIAKGVDVIFPVGGPQEFTVLRAIPVSADIKVIGVDTNMADAATTEPNKGKILGSALKEVKQSIVDAAGAIYNISGHNPLPGSTATGKDVLGKVYTGDLANNWIGFMLGATKVSDATLIAAAKTATTTFPTSIWK